MKIARRTPGYTLIEIMVTLTIISIIFGIGYVAYREFSRRQSLTSAIRAIIGDLQLAQTQAITGTKPKVAVCDYPNLLSGYNFEVIPPNSYKVEAVCSGGKHLVKQVNMSSSVELTAPSPNPIFFKILGQGTNVTSAVTRIDISSLGVMGSVNITSGGSIE